MSKKYLIVDGYYSDWDIKGYFDTLEEAEKHCSARNKGEYVIPINKLVLNEEFKNTKVVKQHNIYFHKQCKKFVKQDYRYESYIENVNALGKKHHLSYTSRYYEVISISIVHEFREVAEKIAEDIIADIHYELSLGFNMKDILKKYSDKYTIVYNGSIIK